VSNLVFIDNNRVVTDSLMVAEVFGKEHKRVLQDIRELGCSDEFNRHNFVLISYKDSMNRDKPKCVITQDGFTLLVMGYTGQQAMEFKEKYIAEFNRMKDELNNRLPALTKDQALSTVLRTTADLIEDTQQIKAEQQEIKQKIQAIEIEVERTTIDYFQQESLSHAKKKRVEQLWADGEVNAEIYDTKQKLHARAWSEFKRAFGVASYKDTPKKKFDEARRYLEAWRPSMI
jgi:Rha family phage regulatory protein